MSTPTPGTDRPLAVVTGASSGIGAATARALAADGWHPVLGARRVERLTEVAEEVGGTALPLDVTDADSVAAFVDGVRDLVTPQSPLRGLVNNAGGAKGTEKVIEADEENAVPWMAPVDADETLVMSLGPTTKLHHAGGTQACLVDGSVRFLKASTPAEVRRALISISGNDDEVAKEW